MEQLKAILKKLIAMPLSNEDIIHAVNGECNFVLYSDIPNYKNVEELLGPYKACVILYNDMLDCGHFVTLLQHPNKPKELEFHDPIGVAIDQELKWIKKVKQYPALTKLAYDGGYSIKYNDQKLQKVSEQIASCGRHSIVRLWLRDYDIDEYCKLIRSSKLSPDELVALVTSEYPKEE